MHEVTDSPRHRTDIVLTHNCVNGVGNGASDEALRQISHRSRKPAQAVELQRVRQATNSNRFADCVGAGGE